MRSGVQVGKFIPLLKKVFLFAFVFFNEAWTTHCLFLGYNLVRLYNTFDSTLCVLYRQIKSVCPYQPLTVEQSSAAATGNSPISKVHHMLHLSRKTSDVILLLY